MCRFRLPFPCFAAWSSSSCLASSLQCCAQAQATCAVAQGPILGVTFSCCRLDIPNYLFTRVLQFCYDPGKYVAVLLISLYSLPAFSPPFASSFPWGLSVLSHSSLSSAHPLNFTHPTTPSHMTTSHQWNLRKQQIWITVSGWYRSSLPVTIRTAVSRVVLGRHKY